MADWQLRLEGLPDLTVEEKLYLDGKLLELGDATAVRYFWGSDADIVKRLRALLPHGKRTYPEGEDGAAVAPPAKKAKAGVHPLCTVAPDKLVLFESTMGYGGLNNVNSCQQLNSLACAGEGSSQHQAYIALEGAARELADRCRGDAAGHSAPLPPPQQAGQAVPQDVDVVGYLRQHYGEALKKVHAEEDPGSLREDDPLKKDRPLGPQMRLMGRDRTFQCLVVQLARIFKLWERRNANVAEEEFRRNLAQLLLLSSPGTRKTSVLEGLLRWLREFLKRPEAELLDFVAEAIYSDTLSQIGLEHARLVREFLGALRRTAGPHHHLAVLRAQAKGLKSADVDRDLGIKEEHAAALRLLYACLCPLDDLSPNGPGLYQDFVRGVSPAVRQQLFVPDVLRFMRAVLEIPEGELFLLLTLVDEGNKASGCWEHDRARQPDDEAYQEPTWLQQFLSDIINTNSAADPKSRSLVVPPTVTTRWTSIDLTWTASGMAQAVNLPTHLMSEEDTLEVVWNLAQRAARADGCDAPDELPPEARQARRHVNYMLGGNPRLLSYALQYMGELGGQSMGRPKKGRLWNPGLDQRLLGLKLNEVSNVVSAVSNRAYDEKFWPRLRADMGMNLAVLKEMLTAIALDTVVRVARVMAESECRALADTWGSLEEQGALTLALQAPLCPLASGLRSALADSSPPPVDRQSIRGAIVAAWHAVDSNPTDDSVTTKPLDIGFVAVGNAGKDSGLVLVEAGDRQRAWTLVVQSKQCFAARPEHETVPGILTAMQSDLEATHTLPKLPREWVTWQQGSSREKLPDCSATWDEAAWDRRVIYAYVSDKLFTSQQEKKDLVEEQHPWMRRQLIIAHIEQACWHSRTGALRRYIRAAALKNKKVRDTPEGMKERTTSCGRPRRGAAKSVRHPTELECS